METTHKQDENGRYVQIVSPAELRRILDESGDDYSRPDWFGPDDEWRVD